jgi:UDP-N-acetylglucosamine 2-epimerase (non-hydrolysing)
MKKILVVFGTRPEAIKMAPIINLLKKDESIECKTCVTAQHRQLLDQVLKIFDIDPEIDLNLMKDNQNLYDLSSRILLKMRDVFKIERPDLVLVHGDTTSSVMAAIAAYYSKIEIGHVEAGLRTNDLFSPWPEEANRQITARLANFHFSPTEIGRLNLLKEGIDKQKIFVTGNTVIDALILILKKIKNDNKFRLSIIKSLKKAGIPLKFLNHDLDKKIILITGHRRENFGSGFREILQGIKKLSLKFPEVLYIYPMHYNPNIRKPIEKIFGNKQERKKIYSNILFIEPLSYESFVFLMTHADIILTDSGGIQEEAPSLGKPVLVMRDTTERPEAVKAGTVKLVGASSIKIFESVSELLLNRKLYNKMAETKNPFGNGFASSKILKIIKKEFT